MAIKKFQSMEKSWEVPWNLLEQSLTVVQFLLKTVCLFLNAQIWNDFSQAVYIMERWSMLHHQSLEKLCIPQHLLLFGQWPCKRPTYGTNMLKFLHSCFFLSPFFLPFPEPHHPFWGLHTIFEAVITPSEAFTTPFLMPFYTTWGPATLSKALTIRSYPC